MGKDFARRLKHYIALQKQEKRAKLKQEVEQNLLSKLDNELPNGLRATQLAQRKLTKAVSFTNPSQEEDLLMEKIASV